MEINFVRFLENTRQNDEIPFGSDVFNMYLLIRRSTFTNWKYESEADKANSEEKFKSQMTQLLGHLALLGI